MILNWSKILQYIAFHSISKPKGIYSYATAKMLVEALQPRTSVHLILLVTAFFTAFFYVFQPTEQRDAYPQAPTVSALKIQHWKSDHFETSIDEVKALPPGLQNPKVRQILEEFETHSFEWQDALAQIIVQAINSDPMHLGPNDQILLDGNKEPTEPQNKEAEKVEEHKYMKPIGENEPGTTPGSKEPETLMGILNESQGKIPLEMPQQWTKEEFVKEALQLPSSAELEWVGVSVSIGLVSPQRRHTNNK